MLSNKAEILPSACAEGWDRLLFQCRALLCLCWNLAQRWWHQGQIQYFISHPRYWFTPKFRYSNRLIREGFLKWLLVCRLGTCFWIWSNRLCRFAVLVRLFLLVGCHRRHDMFSFISSALFDFVGYRISQRRYSPERRKPHWRLQIKREIWSRFFSWWRSLAST